MNRSRQSFLLISSHGGQPGWQVYRFGGLAPSRAGAGPAEAPSEDLRELGPGFVSPRARVATPLAAAE